MDEAYEKVENRIFTRNKFFIQNKGNGQHPRDDAFVQPFKIYMSVEEVDRISRFFEKKQSKFVKTDGGQTILVLLEEEKLLTQSKFEHCVAHDESLLHWKGSV